MKAWSLSKKSQDKEKERERLLANLAKRPNMGGEVAGKNKKV